MTRSRKWFCEFACDVAIAWWDGVAARLFFFLLRMYFDSASVDTAWLWLALLRQLLYAFVMDGVAT